MKKFLQGMINNASRAKFIVIKDMKNKGVERDFLINFKGVLTMKQEQTLGSFNIDLSSL
jgi:hypothetical protein